MTPLEEMFEKRFEYYLNMLLNNGGMYIDLDRYELHNESAQKMYDRLRTTLDMMGIEYTAPVCTKNLKVLTEEQLIEKQKWSDPLNGWFNQTLLYGQAIYKRNALGVVTIPPGDYLIGAVEPPNGTDHGAVTIINGKKVVALIIDDVMREMENEEGHP